MVRALSVDLRDRVVAAMRDGASCRDAAKTFSVSVASAARWSKRARDTGSVAPKPFGKPLGWWFCRNATGCWPAWPRLPT